MIEAAKQLKQKEHAELMFDLIGIACAPHGGQDGLESSRKLWKDRAIDAVPEFRRARVEYDQGTPNIPWKQATQLMFQQLAIMKQVNGGR